MYRTLLAIIVGYVVFAGSALGAFLLLGRTPRVGGSTRIVIAGIVWGIVFAVLAGWVTQKIARRDDLLAVIAVAFIVATGAVISFVLRPGSGAIWSQLAALLLMAPAVLVGGKLAAGKRS
jgi:hypothetical protein